jgi:repressor LexA
MTRGLTDRQAQVLEFIQDFLADHGYPPTVREVAARFGFRSPRAAHDHMKALEKKGFMRSEPGLPRALNLLNRPKGIPVLGRIAAGAPILAVEDADERLDLDPEFFGSGRFFALRVRGDSMIGDHIQEGDLVIIRAQDQAGPGEVAAVLIDDEVTLKRLRPLRDGVELVASNPAVRPIKVGPDQPLRVLGVMAGLVRKS